MHEVALEAIGLLRLLCRSAAQALTWSFRATDVGAVTGSLAFVEFGCTLRWKPLVDYRCFSLLDAKQQVLIYSILPLARNHNEN